MPEPTETTLEQDETQVSEQEQESSDVSEETGSETSEEEKTEETDKEGDKDESKPKYSEKDYNEAVEVKAQSMKDKELKPIRTELEDLKKSNADFKRQLEQREDDKDLKVIFEGEVDEEGETTAKKRDEARRKFAARYREYQEKSETVETREKEIEGLADKLGGIEKRQNATKAALNLVLPKDKGITSEIESIVNRLDEAESPREFDLLLKMITSEYEGKASKKKNVPDSSRSDAPGSVSGLKGDAAINAGLAKEKRKT
jgi:chromosome segregation ATPase